MTSDSGFHPVLSFSLFISITDVIYLPSFRPVSRTATAPFDRLKVFLATRSVESTAALHPKDIIHSSQSTKALVYAIAQIYKEGGVRGYWSLLAIAVLMEYIAEEEEAHDAGPTLHSFSPEPFDHQPGAWGARDVSVSLRGTIDSDRVPRVRRYLPCHYFDYIGGTSTGG